jgi:hypothetical protein
MLTRKNKLNMPKKDVEEVGIKSLKRKYNDAFNANTFDDARFGQHIDDEFFKKNVSDSKTSVEEKEILEWCKYYLANRK